MSFTAKDVQALRQASGAGMMDAKRALEANDGDAEAAAQWLREKGLAKAAERADRANTQGAVALFVDGNVGSIVQLKCETDFVASSEHFKNLVSDMAALVNAKGVEATAERAKEIEDLRLTLKEHIELGHVVRIEAGRRQRARLVPARPGRARRQRRAGRAGRRQRPAGPRHRRARRLRPPPLPAAATRCQADDVEKERATLEAITRNEGKPEQALPKIVEGRLNGYFKEICLLEQPYAKDDKDSISQLLGGATLVRFAQVEIG